MSTTAHRISDDGQTAVCESSPESDCRMAPDCDSETWERNGSCHDHRDMIDGHEDPSTGHPVVPGQDCWYVNGWINPAGLEDTGPEEYPTIRPGAAVDIEFHATDEGCTWTYAEATQ